MSQSEKTATRVQSDNRMSDHEGYVSNQDMENFVDQEFMRAMEEEESKDSVQNV